MLLILLLCTQWGVDNLEAKYFHPRPDCRFQRAESTHSFNVLKYELDLNVPMTERSIQGINTIFCRSREDGLTTAVLHSYTLTIDSILVDGTAATYATSGESLIINLPYIYNTDDSFSIHIGYHGSWSITSYQTGFVYYPKYYNSSTLHSIAYTLAEPWDGRRWMPCYDEPYDKADNGCVITVTVPDTFIVCANGELIDVTNNPDTTITYVWQEDYPIATYLMHFGASRFSVWSDWFVPVSGDSVEIRHFVWPEDSAQAVSALSDVVVSMALLDSMYGPYPFDRYGHDVVYPYAWGGMEHQENTTMHRNVISGSHSWKRIIAHELAHQWWGDMVTCVDFRDIWLNEGCATYSDANYDWYTMGFSYFDSTMQSRAQDYFQADASWRRPLYDPPPGQMFNWGYTYCKASWIMHMLRFLDQDNFFTAMQAYRDSLDYGTASTEDMKMVFSSVYGTDLTWFFDEWVYDQGYPEYDIFWYCTPSGANYLTSINIYQTQTNAPAVFHMPVQILLHTTSSDTLVNIPINNSPEYVEFTISDSVTSIEFDPDDWLLKKYQIYYGIEEYVNNTPLYNDFSFSSNPTHKPEIRFVVNQVGEVRLTLYDIAGRICAVVHNALTEPGYYSTRVNQLPAGVYFCKMETPINIRVKKLVVIK